MCTYRNNGKLESTCAGGGGDYTQSQQEIIVIGLEAQVWESITTLSPSKGNPVPAQTVINFGNHSEEQESVVVRQADCYKKNQQSKPRTNKENYRIIVANGQLSSQNVIHRAGSWIQRAPGYL